MLWSYPPGSHIGVNCLPGGYRASGNSLNAVAFNASRILGPVLAGIIIASSGIALCFALNAISFMAGVLSLFLISHTVAQPVLVQKNSAINDSCEGLRYVAGERNVTLVLLLVAVISLFGIPFVPLLPVFADNILKVGPQGLGYLSAASGIGSLLAALGLAWCGDVRRKGRMIALAGMLFAICLFLFAHSEAYQASLLALVSIGAGMVAFLACISCFLQHTCPDQLRGRVMGIYTFVLIGIAPLGHSMMGLLATNLGVISALSCSSAVCGAAILLSTKSLLKIS